MVSCLIEAAITIGTIGRSSRTLIAQLIPGGEGDEEIKRPSEMVTIRKVILRY